MPRHPNGEPIACQFTEMRNREDGSLYRWGCAEPATVISYVKGSQIARGVLAGTPIWCCEAHADKLTEAFGGRPTDCPNCGCRYSVEAPKKGKKAKSGPSLAAG